MLAAADGGGNGAAPAAAAGAGEAKPLRGPAAMLAKAMDESREVPTATSFRTVAVDTLDAKRKALNEVLNERGMKVSFTHLVAWAIAQAAKGFPVMVRTFEESDGKPVAIEGGPVNLGIAVDVEKKDGSHSLMVPAIKGADGLDFAAFHSYYEDLINKTRENKLTADDFQGTNISLTNPGGIGTVASVPRLMKGQSAIIATGSIAYPAEWAHATPERLRALGVSKVMTLTSTYDHRVIQGAESGAFLRRIEQLLQGEDDFYEGIAADLGIEAGPISAAHPASASAPPLGAPAPTTPAQPDEELLQGVQAATSLLKGYRTHGHLAARLDPLGSEPKGDPAIQPENLNLTPELMARIPASILRIGVPGETLLEVLPRMREAYCGTIAYQFEHLSSHQQRTWLREMVETGAHRQPLEKDEKERLLQRLIDVFEFERFIEKAYLGQKIFTIEGLDAVVPMLDELVTLAHRNGAEEVVFGMAHRGRLSVLAHNLGRSVESILAEFEGVEADRRGQGGRRDPARGHRRRQVPLRPPGRLRDQRRREDRRAPLPEPEPPRVRQPGGRGRHPLHPVGLRGLEARARAEARGAGPAPRRRRLPRPGRRRRDAQPAGAARLLDRRHGPHHPEQPGGLHHRPRGRPLDPLRGRHGEGLQRADHPRQRRRRRGLLGGDPAGDGLPRALGTGHRHRRDRLPPLRPQRDRRARLHPAADRRQDQGPPARLRDLRGEARRGGRRPPRGGRRASPKSGTTEMSDALKDLRKKMELGEYEDPTVTTSATGELDRSASPPVDTAVPIEKLRPLNEALIRAPESFTIHRKLRKPLAKRIDALENGGIEFGHAEALAFASLLTEGVHIRLTGQDTERGTFSHRHLVLHDEKTGLEYCPMQNLEDANAPFELYNSPLSEIACLGFEYGYSAATPNALVLWEAQYGDFANAGQVIIDSFIVSGEAKWGQTSRLTLLLPHGYEGSGPEHSSARIERFLALAAEGNIRIAYPTTAAQYFHLLRRQALIRKPRPLSSSPRRACCGSTGRRPRPRS